MATLQQCIEDLARQVALDQIKQDLDNDEKFTKKTEQNETINRLLALEEKVSRLIEVVWSEEAIEPLTLRTTDASNTNLDAFEVRLGDLETKVLELIEKTWKQEAF